MADYYTHFSCTLEVGAGNVDKALEIFQSYSAFLDNDEESFGATIECEPCNNGNPPTAIWIGDVENGDVEQVIEFVKRIAQALGLAGKWGFEFANTCSRHRLDGFGGGAVVVDLATAKCEWLDTAKWLDEMKAA